MVPHVRDTVSETRACWRLKVIGYQNVLGYIEKNIDDIQIVN